LPPAALRASWPAQYSWSPVSASRNSVEPSAMDRTRLPPLPAWAADVA
jgi:hypothetical protein